MKSFIKLILSNKSGEMPEETASAWFNDTDSMFSNLSPLDKCAFLMHQSVMINYLDRTYDYCLPNLLNLFKQNVVKWWYPELETLTKDETNPNIELFKSAYINIGSLLGLNPINIVAQECMDILGISGQFPMASDVSFYRPYLLFLEKATLISHMANKDAVDNTNAFSINETVSFPQFNIAGSLLIANFDLVFSNYKFDPKDAYQYGEQACGKGVTSIFSYWRNYNWAGFKLNSVVGVLAMQCLELDINAIPKNSLMLGYYDVYRMVVPEWQPHVMNNNNHWLSSEFNFIRRCILFFLMDLRVRFKVIFDDAKLIAKFVNQNDEDSVKVHEFLNADNASEVSVEEYEAFKKSSFVQFTELDIIKHGRVSGRDLVNRLINAKNPSQSDIKKLQQELDGADNDTGDDTEGNSDTNQQDESKSKKSQQDSESGSGQSDTEDVESTLSDIDNIDGANDVDDISTDLNDVDNQDAQGNGANPDDEPNDNSAPDPEGETNLETSDEFNSEDNTHTQTSEVDQDDQDDLPQMGDTKGVKLKLSEGETLDSVLYRDELEAYVDSIITNPPKTLSVQKIEYLKYLKAFWWNLLTIQSLYDNIKAVVRIPKTIKLK